MVILWFILLLISIFVLVKSADLFVDNSEKLGLILGVSKFIIGISVVAIGTSLPELISSLFSIKYNQTEFILGNVIGSNIANIFLIIGITYILQKKLKLKKDIFEGDLFLLFASLGIFFFTLQDGVFNIFDAIICIIGFFIYFYYIIFAKRVPEVELELKPKFNFKIPFFILLGSIGIFFGAKYTVEFVIKLSEFFGFSDTLIFSLSIVAVGTSLPELAVNISAIKKKNLDIAIGNIFGSNIFNIFLVLGVSGIFAKTLTISQSMFETSFIFLILSTVLFTISILNKKPNKSQGIMFILFYVVFLLRIYGII